MEKEKIEELKGLAEDWRVREIFKYLEKNNSTSFRNLSKDVGISKSCTRKRIREMENAGLVIIYPPGEMIDEKIKKGWHPRELYISLGKRKEVEYFRKILEKYST